MLRQCEVVFLHKLIYRSSFIVGNIRFEWKVEFLETWSQRRNTAMLFLQFLVEEKTEVNLLWCICCFLLLFNILIKLYRLMNRIHRVWAGTDALENLLRIQSWRGNLRAHQEFMIIEYRRNLLIPILLYQSIYRLLSVLSRFHLFEAVCTLPQVRDSGILRLFWGLHSLWLHLFVVIESVA